MARKITESERIVLDRLQLGMTAEGLQNVVGQFMVMSFGFAVNHDHVVAHRTIESGNITTRTELYRIARDGSTTRV